VNLKQLRELQLLSQRDVAVALKVTPHTVSAWEMGTKKPRMANMRALKTLYKVSIEQITKAVQESVNQPKKRGC
jgi:DNA-binding transcriptional regulator YiaG